MNLLNRRRFVNNNNKLPYDAELEYMVLPVGSFFLSDYYPNQDTEVECTAYFADSNIAFVCGAADVSKFELFTWNWIMRFQYMGNSGAASIDYNKYLGQCLTVRMKGDGSHSLIDSEGNVIYEGKFTATSFAIGVPMAIWGLNRNNTYSGQNIQSKGKTLLIKEKGEMIAEYIPVRIGSVGYFYDKVSKRLYNSNKEGVPFVPGPDKTGGGKLLKLFKLIKSFFVTERRAA